MSKAPSGTTPEQVTIVARRVLLDGLEALACHIDAITLVGAQAVYLRSTNAAIGTAAYTSDGDLCIDPALLGDEPLIERALHDAGFEPLYANQPGLWCKRTEVNGAEHPIELDLLVGSSFTKGGRGARLPPHASTAARKVPGLEVCVIDRSPMRVTALEEGDGREVTVHVAGTAALLTAKSFKIRDRLNGNDPDRLQDKDAGDVLRLMMTTDPTAVAAAFTSLTRDSRVGEVATAGLSHFRELFGGARTPGVDMAVRALAGDVPEPRVRALAPAFVRRLSASAAPSLPSD